ncbi:protein kinase [Achlya hypogyna]|uniref:Protein kinase n=1 Tax=Achlya hypogyna TaxID=1202772 RepID=A0A1V9YU72_ACHHY|nr:protein kinase [Achlya hypogyna]
MDALCMDRTLENIPGEKCLGTQTWPILPSTLEELFINATLDFSTPDESIPPALASLTVITSMQLTNVPVTLTHLPNTLTNLSLLLTRTRANAPLNLANTDFSSLKSLRLSGITSFTNVTLSTNLTTFDCTSCKLAGLVVDEATYATLRTLRPMDSTGVGYRLGAVSMTNTTCARQQGALLPLWTNTTFVACVVGAVAPSTSSSTAILSEVLRSNDTATVVVVVFVLLATAIAGAAALYLFQRRRSRRDAAFAAAVGLGELQLHRILAKDILVGASVAVGAISSIWLGTYHGSPVAIKRLTSQNDAAVTRFISEMHLVAKLESPYLVAVFGVSWTSWTDLQVIMECMDRGDLQQYLRHTVPVKFPWELKARCIQHIVYGLVYLHSLQPPVLHRNLTSTKVLLDSVNGTKLAVFRVARKADDDTALTKGLGTYQWMAPEVLVQAQYAEPADIYSFGVILSELSTHKTPYEEVVEPESRQLLTMPAVMAKVVMGELAPTLDEDAPQWVHDVARECLALDTNERPTALELAMRLNALLDQYNLKAK